MIVQTDSRCMDHHPFIDEKAGRIEAFSPEVGIVIQLLLARLR